MIAACYSMDLYCDSEQECRGKDAFGPVRHIGYTGETWGEVVREARRDGWRITRGSKRQAFCPYCTGKRKIEGGGE